MFSCIFHTCAYTHMSSLRVSSCLSVSLIVEAVAFLLGRGGFCPPRIRFVLVYMFCGFLVFLTFLSVARVGGPTPHGLDPGRHRTLANVRSSFLPSPPEVRVAPPGPSEGAWPPGTDTGPSSVVCVILVALL